MAFDNTFAALRSEAGTDNPTQKQIYDFYVKHYGHSTTGYAGFTPWTFYESVVPKPLKEQHKENADLNKINSYDYLYKGKWRVSQGLNMLALADTIEQSVAGGNEAEDKLKVSGAYDDIMKLADIYGTKGTGADKQLLEIGKARGDLLATAQTLREGGQKAVEEGQQAIDSNSLEWKYANRGGEVPMSEKVGLMMAEVVNIYMPQTFMELAKAAPIGGVAVSGVTKAAKLGLSAIKSNKKLAGKVAKTNLNVARPLSKFADSTVDEINAAGYAGLGVFPVMLDQNSQDAYQITLDATGDPYRAYQAWQDKRAAIAPGIFLSSALLGGQGVIWSKAGGGLTRVLAGSAKQKIEKMIATGVFPNSVQQYLVSSGAKLGAVTTIAGVSEGLQEMSEELISASYNENVLGQPQDMWAIAGTSFGYGAMLGMMMGVVGGAMDAQAVGDLTFEINEKFKKDAQKELEQADKLMKKIGEDMKRQKAANPNISNEELFPPEQIPRVEMYRDQLQRIAENGGIDPEIAARVANQFRDFYTNLLDLLPDDVTEKSAEKFYGKEYKDAEDKFEYLNQILNKGVWDRKSKDDSMIALYMTFKELEKEAKNLAASPDAIEDAVTTGNVEQVEALVGNLDEQDKAFIQKAKTPTGHTGLKEIIKKSPPKNKKILEAMNPDRHKRKSKDFGGNLARRIADGSSLITSVDVDTITPKDQKFVSLVRAAFKKNPETFDETVALALKQNPNIAPDNNDLRAAFGLEPLKEQKKPPKKPKEEKMADESALTAAQVRINNREAELYHEARKKLPEDKRNALRREKFMEQAEQEEKEGKLPDTAESKELAKMEAERAKQDESKEESPEKDNDVEELEGEISMIDGELERLPPTDPMVASLTAQKKEIQAKLDAKKKEEASQPKKGLEGDNTFARDEMIMFEFYEAKLNETGDRWLSAMDGDNSFSYKEEETGNEYGFDKADGMFVAWSVIDGKRTEHKPNDNLRDAITKLLKEPLDKAKEKMEKGFTDKEETKKEEKAKTEEEDTQDATPTNSFTKEEEKVLIAFVDEVYNKGKDHKPYSWKFNKSRNKFTILLGDAGAEGYIYLQNDRTFAAYWYQRNRYGYNEEYGKAFRTLEEALIQLDDHLGGEMDERLNAEEREKQKAGIKREEIDDKTTSFERGDVKIVMKSQQNGMKIVGYVNGKRASTLTDRTILNPETAVRTIERDLTRDYKKTEGLYLTKIKEETVGHRIYSRGDMKIEVEPIENGNKFRMTIYYKGELAKGGNNPYDFTSHNTAHSSATKMISADYESILAMLDPQAIFSQFPPHVQFYSGGVKALQQWTKEERADLDKLAEKFKQGAAMLFRKGDKVVGTSTADISFGSGTQANKGVGTFIVRGYGENILGITKTENGYFAHLGAQGDLLMTRYDTLQEAIDKIDIFKGGAADPSVIMGIRKFEGDAKLPPYQMIVWTNLEKTNIDFSDKDMEWIDDYKEIYGLDTDIDESSEMKTLTFYKNGEEVASLMQFEGGAYVQDATLEANDPASMAAKEFKSVQEAVKYIGGISSKIDGGPKGGPGGGETDTTQDKQEPDATETFSAREVSVLEKHFPDGNVDEKGDFIIGDFKLTRRHIKSNVDGQPVVFERWNFINNEWKHIFNADNLANAIAKTILNLELRHIEDKNRPQNENLAKWGEKTKILKDGKYIEYNVRPLSLTDEKLTELKGEKKTEPKKDDAESKAKPEEDAEIEKIEAEKKKDSRLHIENLDRPKEFHKNINFTKKEKTILENIAERHGWEVVVEGDAAKVMQDGEVSIVVYKGKSKDLTGSKNYAIISKMRGFRNDARYFFPENDEVRGATGWDIIKAYIIYISAIKKNPLAFNNLYPFDTNDKYMYDALPEMNTMISRIKASIENISYNTKHKSFIVNADGLGHFDAILFVPTADGVYMTTADGELIRYDNLDDALIRAEAEIRDSLEFIEEKTGTKIIIEEQEDAPTNIPEPDNLKDEQTTEQKEEAAPEGEKESKSTQPENPEPKSSTFDDADKKAIDTAVKGMKGVTASSTERSTRFIVQTDTDTIIGPTIQKSEGVYLYNSKKPGEPIKEVSTIQGAVAMAKEGIEQEREFANSRGPKVEEPTEMTGTEAVRELMANPDKSIVVKGTQATRENVGEDKTSHTIVYDGEKFVIYDSENLFVNYIKSAGRMANMLDKVFAEKRLQGPEVMMERLREDIKGGKARKIKIDSSFYGKFHGKNNRLRVGAGFYDEATDTVIYNSSPNQMRVVNMTTGEITIKIVIDANDIQNAMRRVGIPQNLKGWYFQYGTDIKENVGEEVAASDLKDAYDLDGKHTKYEEDLRGMLNLLEEMAAPDTDTRPAIFTPKGDAIILNQPNLFDQGYYIYKNKKYESVEGLADVLVKEFPNISGSLGVDGFWAVENAYNRIDFDENADADAMFDVLMDALKENPSGELVLPDGSLVSKRGGQYVVYKTPTDRVPRKYKDEAVAKSFMRETHFNQFLDKKYANNYMLKSRKQLRGGIRYDDAEMKRFSRRATDKKYGGLTIEELTDFVAGIEEYTDRNEAEQKYNELAKGNKKLVEAALNMDETDLVAIIDVLAKAEPSIKDIKVLYENDLRDEPGLSDLYDKLYTEQYRENDFGLYTEETQDTIENEAEQEAEQSEADWQALYKKRQEDSKEDLNDAAELIRQTGKDPDDYLHYNDTGDSIYITFTVPNGTEWKVRYADHYNQRRGSGGLDRRGAEAEDSQVKDNAADENLFYQKDKSDVAVQLFFEISKAFGIKITEEEFDKQEIEGLQERYGAEKGVEIIVAPDGKKSQIRFINNDKIHKRDIIVTKGVGKGSGTGYFIDGTRIAKLYDDLGPAITHHLNMYPGNDPEYTGIAKDVDYAEISYLDADKSMPFSNKDLKQFKDGVKKLGMKMEEDGFGGYSITTQQGDQVAVLDKPRDGYYLSKEGGAPDLKIKVFFDVENTLKYLDYVKQKVGDSKPKAMLVHTATPTVTSRTKVNNLVQKAREIAEKTGTSVTLYNGHMFPSNTDTGYKTNAEYNPAFGTITVSLASHMQGQELERTLSHEIFGHHGLELIRRTGDTSVDKQILKILESKDENIVRIRERVMELYPDATSNLEIAEEVVANVAESNFESNFIRDIISAIVSWFRELFGMDVNMATIHNVLRKSRAAVYKKAETYVRPTGDANALADIHGNYRRTMDALLKDVNLILSPHESKIAVRTKDGGYLGTLRYDGKFERERDPDGNFSRQEADLPTPARLTKQDMAEIEKLRRILPALSQARFQYISDIIDNMSDLEIGDLTSASYMDYVEKQAVSVMGGIDPPAYAHPGGTISEIVSPKPTLQDNRSLYNAFDQYARTKYPNINWLWEDGEMDGAFGLTMPHAATMAYNTFHSLEQGKDIIDVAAAYYSLADVVGDAIIKRPHLKIGASERDAITRYYFQNDQRELNKIAKKFGSVAKAKDIMDSAARRINYDYTVRHSRTKLEAFKEKVKNNVFTPLPGANLEEKSDSFINKNLRPIIQALGNDFTYTDRHYRLLWKQLRNIGIEIPFSSLRTQLAAQARTQTTATTEYFNRFLRTIGERGDVFKNLMDEMKEAGLLPHMWNQVSQEMKDRLVNDPKMPIRNRNAPPQRDEKGKLIREPSIADKNLTQAEKDKENADPRNYIALLLYANYTTEVNKTIDERMDGIKEARDKLLEANGMTKTRASFLERKHNHLVMLDKTREAINEEIAGNQRTPYASNKHQKAAVKKISPNISNESRLEKIGDIVYVDKREQAVLNDLLKWKQWKRKWSHLRQTGMELRDADAIMKVLGKNKNAHRQFRKAKVIFKEMTEQVLDYWVSMGIYTEEQVQDYRDFYKLYVHLAGEESHRVETLTQSPGLSDIVHREKRINASHNVLYETFGIMRSHINSATKQALMNEMYNYAITELETKTGATDLMDDDAITEMFVDYDQVQRAAAERGDVGTISPLDIFIVTPEMEGRSDEDEDLDPDEDAEKDEKSKHPLLTKEQQARTIRFTRKGRKVAISFNDQRKFQEIDRMMHLPDVKFNYQWAQNAVSHMRSLNNLMKNTATVFNPIFIYNNLFRDIQDSITMYRGLFEEAGIDVGDDPKGAVNWAKSMMGDSKEFVGNYKEAMSIMTLITFRAPKSFFSDMSIKKIEWDNVEKYGEAWAKKAREIGIEEVKGFIELNWNGGLLGLVHGLQKREDALRDFAKRVENQMATVEGMNEGMHDLWRDRRMNAFNLISDFSSMFEYAPRWAIYKMAKKAKRTDGQPVGERLAISMAQEITQNFGRMGNWTSNKSGWGVYIQIQNLYQRVALGGMYRYFTRVIQTQNIPEALGLMQEKEYKAAMKLLVNRQMAIRGFIMPAVFFMAYQMIAAALDDEERTAYADARSMRILFTDYSMPIGRHLSLIKWVSDYSSDFIRAGLGKEIDHGKRFDQFLVSLEQISAPVPIFDYGNVETNLLQFFAPVGYAEWAAGFATNRNYFGGHITPPEYWGQKPPVKADSGFKSTHSVWKNIASGIERIGGPDFYPESYKYTLQYFGNGLYNSVEDMFNFFDYSIYKITQEDKWGAKVPSNIFTDTSLRTAKINRFFTNVKRAESRYNLYKAYVEGGNQEKAANLLEAYPDLLEEYSKWNSLRQAYWSFVDQESESLPYTERQVLRKKEVDKLLSYYKGSR